MWSFNGSALTKQVGHADVADAEGSLPSVGRPLAARNALVAFMTAGTVAVAGCGPIMHQNLRFPLNADEITTLRTNLDGRTVDVDHLSGPLRTLESGRAVYAVQRTSGTVRLAAPGQSLLIRVDDGHDTVIPLSNTRLITDDQRFRWIGIGALSGLASGIGFCVLASRGGKESEGDCPECVVLAYVLVPVLGTLIGALVGAPVGRHKSAQWRLTNAAQILE
jgi:hypothetical protein